MVNYKCFRCGYECNQKGTLLNHLVRKKRCKSILKEIDNYEILRLNKIEEYNKDKYKVIQKSLKSNSKNDLKSSESHLKEYKCRYCDKIYKYKQGRWKHEQKCKEKENKIETEKKLEELEEQNKELLNKLVNLDNKLSKSNKSVNKSIIKGDANTNNGTINIQVNNFDRENLDYISGRQALKFAKNFKGLIGNFIDLVHFNKKHPENHTIRIKDMKNGMAEIRDKNSWSYISMSDFLDEMRLSLYDKLETLKDNICEDDLEIYDDYLDRVNELLEDMKKVKVINSKIKVASINGTNKIYQRSNVEDL